MKHLHTIFKGRVQGVGFRATVQKIAAKYPVTGYVRNLADGTVEMEAEAEAAILEAFLKSIKTCHLMLFIRDVKTDWGEARGEWETFCIK